MFCWGKQHRQYEILIFQHSFPQKHQLRSKMCDQYKIHNSKVTKKASEFILAVNNICYIRYKQYIT